MTTGTQSTALGSVSPDYVERRAFEKDLIEMLPQMRAFARFLTGDPVVADDLIQEAIVPALRAYRTFAMGSNLKAWMFTIIRNTRINGLRKPRPEHLDDVMIEGLRCPPNQDDSLDLQYVLSALDGLSPPFRDIIILVRASGVSYEDAARILGCKVGTIKSRLNRADAALREVIGKDFRAPRVR